MVVGGRDVVLPLQAAPPHQEGPLRHHQDGKEGGRPPEDELRGSTNLH